MRDKLVQIKVDEAEHGMIKTAARRAGETIMGWGRKVLVDEAQEALGVEVVEKVEFGETMAASDAPPPGESWPAPRVDDLLQSSEPAQETVYEPEPEPEPVPTPEPQPEPPAQAAAAPINLIDPLEDLL